MNTAGVTVVVTALSKFQIEIVPDLQGYMECGKQINVDLDVRNILAWNFVFQQNKIVFFSSIILCSACCIVDICERIYVTLSLVQHRMYSHSITLMSLQTQRKFN